MQQRPNIHQGFGRVDVKRATQLSNDILIDNTTGVAQGDTVTHTVNVEEESDLMVTLLYTDAPGAPSASKALVNDLDMSISGGNASSNQQDRVNNFEYALIKGVQGQVQIKVKGFRIPQARNGALPYALVISAGQARSQDDGQAGNDDDNNGDDDQAGDNPGQGDEEEDERSIADIIDEILKQLLG